MFVHVINQIADLARYEVRWDQLAADCPFRSWTWLSTWWKHYAAGHQLSVLLLFDEAMPCVGSPTCSASLPAPEKLVAILPTYLESTCTRGRVLHLLGDGEVCSEHLDLLCEKDRVAEASDLLAEHLTGHADSWDSVILDTIVEPNRNLGELVQAFEAYGCQIEKSAGVNLWSIPLPASWEDYLAMQSKSHRKQLRQLKSRVLEGPRACWSEVYDHATFDIAWEVLVDLHQRRRQSLGEPGCFASPRWANFHREVALELLAAGRLKLSVLRLDDRPVAAEYHIAGSDATYAYQGGIDPDHVVDEPGQLSLIKCIGQAIDRGHERFELLRGDEPYKAHWRAVPTPTANFEIVSPRALARWRHYSWNGLRRAGRIARQFTNMLS